MIQSRNKIIQSTNAISGGVSVLGSYQVCHNICMGLIAMLSLLGISVIGMPLVFLTRIAFPFWIAAVSLLAMMVFLKTTILKSLSTNMMILNTGLIIMGIPFENLQIYKNYFFITGGLLVSVAIILMIAIKRSVKNEAKC